MTEDYQSKGQIKTATLDSILEETPYKNQEIDLLSVDAEGHDFKVIKALSFEKYNPKVILIELHFRNFSDIQSSELYQFLLDKGYKFANWVGYTLFFLKPGNQIIKPEKNI